MPDPIRLPGIEDFCERYRKVRSVQLEVLALGTSINRLDTLIELLSRYPQYAAIKDLVHTIPANPRTTRGTLHELVCEGLVVEIKVTSDSRYKYFHLSPRGVQVMCDYVARIAAIDGNANEVRRIVDESTFPDVGSTKKRYDSIPYNVKRRARQK